MSQIVTVINMLKLHALLLEKPGLLEVTCMHGPKRTHADRKLVLMCVSDTRGTAPADVLESSVSAFFEEPELLKGNWVAFPLSTKVAAASDKLFR